MHSLQRLITFLLLSSVILVVTVAVLGGYRQLVLNTQQLYDGELQSVAHSLIQIPLDSSSFDSQALLSTADNGFLAIQIWQDTQLLFHTQNSPTYPVSQVPGFMDVNFLDDRWRVFMLEANNRKVIVAYSLSERGFQTDQFIASSIWPLLIALPILVILIIGSVKFGLRPMQQLTKLLAKRSSHALQPIELDHDYAELNPVVATINRLLNEVEQGMSREKSFSGNVAHELRTPLSILALSLQNSLNEIPKDYHGRIDAQKNEVARLTRIVNQLLLLSQTHPEHHQVIWQSIPIEALTQEVISDHYSSFMAKEQSIELVCELPSDFMYISESELFSSLLGNVLSNAHKYAPAGGKVMLWLSLDEASKSLMLRIDNEGTCPSSSTLSMMSQRFYRAPEHHHIQGAGLGLALVKQIVALHEGTITFMQSDSLGGVSVSISLPVFAGLSA